MGISADSGRPTLLGVGALERDNFGDLLYAEILFRVASQYDVSLGAPIAPRVDLPLEVPVEPWAEQLAARRFDAVWAVGGEVGGTTLEYAYMTTFGLDSRRELVHADHATWHERLATAMGGRVLDPPYIPRVSGFALNAATPLVINSIGLSGIENEPAWRRPHLAAAIREATFVSVRDRASSAYLDREGIAHSLAPDVAHLIARIRPVPRPADGPVLVHLSVHSFAEVEVEEWAQSLDAAVPSGREIRLFIAGLAPGHDTLEGPEALASAIRARTPGRAVSVSSARGVWDRTDEIARASLWIGGSLHGRIVASAYGIPRVSLAKPKVDAYARDWDPDQPFGVTLDTLAAAVTNALGTEVSPADHLAEAAQANADAALASIGSVPAVEVLVARVDALATEAALAHDVGHAQVVQIDRITNELRVTRTQRENAKERLTLAHERIATLNEQIARIRGSLRWRLFTPLDRLRNLRRR